QGPVVLERLEESLAQGSRSPMLAAAVDEPSRKLLLSSPVLQVVNANTVKDRFLFLFTDILVIAKPVIQESDNVLDPAWALVAPDKKFIVKSVVRLRDLRFSDERSDSQTKGSNATALPRSAAMRAFVHQFARDPDMAISTLLTKAGTAGNAAAVGQLLFRTLELDRASLGEYLSQRTSKVVLKTFVDTFGFAGIRVDKALRAFLMSIHVPSRAPPSALDTLLDAFASRWYVANAGIVAYDRDLAIRFVRAIVQLNELLHGSIASEPGPTGYMMNQISTRDFMAAFRRFDPRYLVADDLLEDVYHSIRGERLSMARDSSSGGPVEIPVTIKRPVPMRLTYKIQSEPIIFRIPQPDNQFAIHLSGQGLIFDPDVLYFSRSPEASFRVTGTALGPTTLVLRRAGPNALRYNGLPLSSSIRVERAFMRNTFQVAFRERGGAKRRYMFSVDDHLLRHQWATYLPRQIRACAGDGAVIPPGAFHPAAENVALAVLQDTLIGRRASRVVPAPTAHVRSKSRSKVYHRHGAGRNELELG
ncbi:Sec7 domain-containing protein, partial [Schizophyllum amplum]